MNHQRVSASPAHNCRPTCVHRPNPRKRYPLLGSVAAAMWLTSFRVIAAESGHPAVLHTPLPVDVDAALPGQSASVFVYRFGRPGEFPAAIRREGVLLPAPTADPNAGFEEWLHGQPPDTSPDGNTALSGGKQTATADIEPDAATEADDVLHYREVFEPSIAPFKRSYARDVVGSDGHIRVGEPEQIAVTVLGPQRRTGRELFWASLMVRFVPDVSVAIPSVAPDMGVLAVESRNGSAVTFWRDKADNYFVRSAQDGEARLNLLLDAPVGYFARPLPRRAEFEKIPEGRRPQLPHDLQARAQRLWPVVGLRRNDALPVQLAALVSYFRGFQPGPLPRQSGNLYEDLVRARVGVCRHRAYAFVITAHSLGLPARFVGNEAHAFVEVWLPGVEEGWLRIDLGGAARQLDVQGALQRARHLPQWPDPFARPPRFAQGYSAEALEPGIPSGRIVHGLGQTLAQRRANPEASLQPGTVARSFSANGLLLSPGATLTSCRLLLTIRETTAYRGEPVHIQGRLTEAAGRPIAQQRVELLLVPYAATASQTSLGATTTAADGSYQAMLRIPAVQPPGTYSVVAQFSGTGAWSGCRSDEQQAVVRMRP